MPLQKRLVWARFLYSLTVQTSASNPTSIPSAENMPSPVKSRAEPDQATVWVRPPPIDIRFRLCRGCGQHKPAKGGSIFMRRGRSGGFFLCAECKPRPPAS